MIKTGTIRLPYNNMFPDQQYLVALPTKPMTLHSLDPNRLDPLHEYPRDTAIYYETIESMTELVADFRAEIVDGEDGFFKTFNLYIVPSKYSQTKEERLAYKMQVSIQCCAGQFDWIVENAIRTITKK